ncbi:unnamed protein product [Orchesella dallaii]|uniref:Uncharacterized protein n=1 Tax=Orchesella dallaii TaxID=48710 RepID=A0ABP1RLR6_9HEXA
MKFTKLFTKLHDEHHIVLKQILAFASTCTLHYVRDNSHRTSDPFNLFFESSSKSRSIHLLTTDKNNTYLAQNATTNNWYHNNTYQSGIFEGRAYKRGYWEIFKGSKFLETCQFQVVDVLENWNQLFDYIHKFLLESYGSFVPIPNYLMLVLSKHGEHKSNLTLRKVGKRVSVNVFDNLIIREHILRVYSRLPIFSLTNASIHFTPFVVRTYFRYDYRLPPHPAYVLPFFYGVTNWSTIEVQSHWKTLFLANGAELISIEKHYTLAEDYCDRFISMKFKSAIKKKEFQLVYNCLIAEFLVANISLLKFKRHQYDVQSHSIEFKQLFMKYTYLFRYDISFHGYRYLVFLDVTRADSNTFIDMGALLLPFSIVMWIFTIFATLFIVILLYKAGHKCPFFYTFAVLLEQGDTTSQSRMSIWISVTTLFIWGFVLRLSYTSSMYSYLTVVPEPVVPKDFEESVENDNYYKLSHPEIVKGIFDRMQHEFDSQSGKYIVAKPTQPLLESLSKKIYALYLLPGYLNHFFTDQNITRDSQLTALASSNNTVFVSRYCLEESEVPGILIEKYYFISDCRNEFVVANKFVYIYDFPYHFDEIIGLDLFAAILFGNKKIFSNNNPSRFHIVYGWSAEYDLSAIIADDIIGKLEQTGTLSRWNKVESIFKLLDSWKEIMGWEAFKGSLSNNVVQVAYDLLEDLRHVEYIKQDISGKQIPGVTNRALATVWILFLIGNALSLLMIVSEILTFFCNNSCVVI